MMTIENEKTMPYSNCPVQWGYIFSLVNVSHSNDLHASCRQSRPNL